MDSFLTYLSFIYWSAARESRVPLEAVFSKPRPRLLILGSFLFASLLLISFYLLSPKSFKRSASDFGYKSYFTSGFRFPVYSSSGALDSVFWFFYALPVCKRD